MKLYYLKHTSKLNEWKELMKVGIGSHILMFLTGRYDKTPVNNRHCLSYSSDEIEDPLL